MGPRIYPSYQDTNSNASGSLILSFVGNQYYNVEIYINSNITNKQYSDVNGLYTYKINQGDVVTILGPGAWSINLIRRDYTTDDTSGNNGIIDTLITGTTAIGSFTFTTSTIPSSYNFEYRTTIMDFGPTPTPTPTPCPTYSYISSGLTIYTDFSNPASYNGTGPTWYDLQGNFNGTISGQTEFGGSYINPCARWMFLQQNNEASSITFPVGSISAATTNFSFGGWVDGVSRNANYIFTRGFTNTKITLDFYGRPVYSIERDIPNGTRSKTGTTQVNYGSFNYLYLTYNGSEMKGYLNGILQVTLSVSAPIVSSIYGWGMGNVIYDTADASVSISDFTEYNRLLSDAEVLTNYNYKKDLFPTYTPLTSGVTIEWVYNWTGSTNNVYLNEFYQDIGALRIPFLETDTLLPAYGGSISGSTVTYQSIIAGNFNSNNIISVLNYCDITTPATLTTPRNWSWYKNDVLQYTTNGTGNVNILGCGAGTTETWSQTGATVVNIQDGDKLKYVVNNYFLPDPTPTPTPLPPTNTPTPTTSPTPSPTPTPLPFIEGYTILVNDSAPSYPGTGTTWTSIATGTTYNATMVNGPVWSGGTPGFFTFDGTNDYGDFGLSSTGATTGSCTWGAWFRTTTSALEKVIAMRGNDGSPDGWSLLISKTATGKMSVGVVNTTPFIASTFAESTTTLVSNTWYYVYGVWTSGTNIKIYVNGSLENTTSNTRTGLRTSGVGWSLMAGNGGTFTNGSISEFVTYNTILSDAEILNNFNLNKSKYGY
jgi:hypothetical protein